MQAEMKSTFFLRKCFSLDFDNVRKFQESPKYLSPAAAMTTSNDDRKSVHFAQINGMADQLSMGLALAGHSVLKLVPCGSVAEVLPWLARRMQENAGVIHRTEWDATLLKKEILRRRFGFFARRPRLLHKKLFRNDNTRP